MDENQHLAQKERAERIRLQIAELKARKKGKPSPKRPMSPREFIDQQVNRGEEKTPQDK
jgi:hypothetical protein